MNLSTAIYPSLSGRAVMLTGGATGIGAALVEAFCAQGARVFFIDLLAEPARVLCDRIENAGNEAPSFSIVDAGDPAALKASIEIFAATAGRLDVLVNNVANDDRHAADAVTPDDWRRCLGVNLDAAFFAAQQAARAMRAQGGGAIINISSINALFGPPGMAGYVAAKAGLLGLTKALAREFGPNNIRVNAVLPGWVATEKQLAMWLTPDVEREWEKQVALKGRLTPEDVARLVLFLAADDSRMITGQQFVIDAGRM